jgi:hypothetical protein
MRAVWIGIALLTALWGAEAQTCDRACLEGFVDRYLDAMIAHDPAKLQSSKARSSPRTAKNWI